MDRDARLQQPQGVLDTFVAVRTELRSGHTGRWQAGQVAGPGRGRVGRGGHRFPPCQKIWTLWTPTASPVPCAEPLSLFHLHHTSVARRLEQIGKAMGIEVTEPTGLTRARLALTSWRLLDG